jgi:hypothetical protein
MKTLWEKFDGNKTIIGVFLLQVAQMLPAGNLQTVFLFIGSALSGVGITHKAVKAVTE